MEKLDYMNDAFPDVPLFSGRILGRGDEIREQAEVDAEFDLEPTAVGRAVLSMSVLSDLGREYAARWGEPVTLRVTFITTLRHDGALFAGPSIESGWTSETVDCVAIVTGQCDGISSVAFESTVSQDDAAKGSLIDFNDDERAQLEHAAREAFYESIETINR